MLTIERRSGASVLIGDEIRVTVRAIRNQRVRLSIDAPRDTVILREELARRLPEGGRWLPEPAPAPDPSPSPSPPASPTSSPLRVIVVEDNPGHALLIRHALEKRGIDRITVLHTGASALREITREPSSRAGRPDLILLDLRLPDMPGLRVLETLRSQPALRTVPVVILSSTGDQPLIEKCLTAGANAFVPKTARYAEFRDSITRLADFWARARFVA